MLVAYIDESGHSADPKCRFAGMGGLVAESSEWQKFEISWGKALRDAGAVGPFHMKDFAHRQGAFKGWEEVKRRALFRKLVQAITQIKAIPVGCVVSLDAFNSAHPELRRFYEDPYYMSFQHATRGAALQALPKDVTFQPEVVDMIYAQQLEFGATEAKPQTQEDQTGRAQKLWSAMKKLTIYGQWMGTYGSASPSDCCQLQAADLFAYELVKEFENRLKRPKDEMRWALRQILPLGGEKPLIQFFDEYELIRIFMEATGQDKSGKSPVTEIITEAYMRKMSARELMRQRTTGK